MKETGVGILGFGTVGAGVADGLLRHREVMARRLGVDIALRRIADLDITTDRGIAVPEGILTTDAASVIADPSIQIVVETIGGTGIAKKFVLDALNAKKSVKVAGKTYKFPYMLTDNSGMKKYLENGGAIGDTVNLLVSDDGFAIALWK